MQFFHHLMEELITWVLRLVGTGIPLGPTSSSIVMMVIRYLGQRSRPVTGSARGTDGFMGKGKKGQHVHVSMVLEEHQGWGAWPYAGLSLLKI